ncbi:hypothetical protein METBIDRAFT_200501 [Metschnikowia bicuspidata var. bicuspidata NRRL YB-4993]|uniref:Uncharacterized protein n=1 Tax=Metschnikowia bicuspidata var. bicuspidata NRRL YB-4993 TaxID=869754 RepID=A0A1A0H8V6_9ASCO|nr:hypothetical protein METBIDRAFT_200501 [Metschnikowia bicuspidata var. bicuspidata NRRL YB-4993]OBA20554.1 hypothetical protein METBIDRAFT_200501 [Metschnikowia bicuspidata var. bicuspidata NRRL YB-4993]
MLSNPTQSEDSSVELRPQKKLTELQAQISSVGFATLKKQATNTSQGSSLNTNTSGKRSLHRFFSRKKTILEPNNWLSNRLSRDELELVDQSEEFKLSKLHGDVNYLESSRSTLDTKKTFLSKNESTVHGRRNKRSNARSLSRKPSFLESSTLKKANSPSIQLNSLFHRPHTSLTDQNAETNSESREFQQNSIYTSLRRNIVQLSSQSSNSYITDRVAASTYHFTDPNHGIGVDSRTVEGTTIFELHRRYMTSADTYIQKHHRTAPESPIVGFQPDELRLGLHPGDEHYTKAFSDIFDLITPILCPREHLPEGKGSQELQKLCIEEMESFVEQRLLGIRHEIKKNPSQEEKIDNFPKRIFDGQVSNWISTDGADDERTELELKEFLTQISRFFLKCCQTLADIFIHKKAPKLPEDSFGLLTIQSSDSENLQEFSELKRELTIYLENWRLIARAWNYFNSNVRFYLLHIFVPAESYLEFLFSQDSKFESATRRYTFDNDILLAFRDTFILPQLHRRMILLSCQDNENDIFKKMVEYNEQTVFENPECEISKTLTNCLGFLSTCSARDSLTSDDERHGEILLSEFLRLLKLQSRKKPARL